MIDEQIKIREDSMIMTPGLRIEHQDRKTFLNALYPSINSMVS